MSEVTALGASRRPAPGPRAPRRTVRLRLTLWYGGLFLACGAALLAITYGLVVQAFAGGTARNATCRRPGAGCHAVGAGLARAAALAAHAGVLHELLTRSLLALGLTAVLAAGLGWLIAGRVLRPLRQITAIVREISATRLSERLALAGPRDELSELADTFDGLLARLEASFQAQRQFIANASHELRTPLARQRVISQVALASPDATIQTLREAHERVLVSGTELHQLLDALLTLARGQAGLDQREPFDLATLTGQVLATRSGEARARTLAVCPALEPAATAGSPELAERLIANLLDNALRHNEPGGQVEIATQTAGGCAVLSVANTGPVVPPASVGQLFEPFQRLGADRTSRRQGQGLGLSIVQAIANSHGAAIATKPRPGGGLLIEVTFPPER